MKPKEELAPSSHIKSHDEINDFYNMLCDIVCVVRKHQNAIKVSHHINMFVDQEFLLSQKKYTNRVIVGMSDETTAATYPFQLED